MHQIIARAAAFFQSIESMIYIHLMNLNSLDLNLLVALDALLKEANVSRAAMRIGLSQPAASHALQRLRDLIGDPLLVRTGARMELTPRAQALRAPLAQTLDQARAVAPPKGGHVHSALPVPDRARNGDGGSSSVGNSDNESLDDALFRVSGSLFGAGARSARGFSVRA